MTEMITRFGSTELPPIPGCEVCHGTGFDEAFQSRCDCHFIAGGKVTEIMARLSGGGETTERTLPTGGGTGTGKARTERMTGPEVKALAEWLMTQTWSEFAQSVGNFYLDRGWLSSKQVASATSMRAKCEARQAEREARKPEPVVEASIAPAVEAGPVSAPCQIGTFTLETEDGHITFRTRMQAEDASFAPGETIISFLSGPDNEGSYTGFAFVKPGAVIKPWKRFAESTRLIERAERALAGGEDVHFAQRCLMCNRLLTTPSSISSLIGPECAKKV